MQEYHRYEYDGPVMEFDRIIDEHWYGETMAPNKNRAKSNLAYQFKKTHNKIARTKITLPGEITEIN